ncbi:MAG TPA: GlsB/YeaQ/YmgE family stress response membrane protein [Candidatus Dormibacteraeota bacterium]|nr:GlsB/YeaQ/YmgE family stress response membrane protein [Candidatus Dormibacteraeota bacterium]
MSVWLAAVLLSPGGVLAWIVIGLVAGAVAGRLVRGRGLGCLMDLVVGVLGAFIGGFLLSLFLPGGTSLGFLGSLVVATLGAVILLAFVRLVSRGR